MKNILAIFVLVLLAKTQGLAAESTLQITQVEPTPLFPKPAAGQPLRQLARLHLDNPGEPAQAAAARITVGTQPSDTQPLASIVKGKSAVNILIPDLERPTPVTVEMLSQDGQRLAARTLEWQPQKKWKIFSVSYSHHDLGYGNYPHRLRTEIRHANLERPLKFCAETDGWEEDSKFRFMVETSEPIPSFLGSHSEAEAQELGRRIREGRIQIGGVHNTANTEQLSHELMARLFYLTGRHTRDLLEVPRSRTAQIDDVIGLTWPLATFCRAADIDYFFHGHNGCSTSLLPAAREPVFYWQGPDGASKVLVRSIDYGGYAGDSIGDGSAGHLEKSIARLGAHWPYHTLLLQEGTDFQLVTLDTANKIRAWNSQYRYPHLVCATMDMFFDDLARQATASQIKTFAKDGNNQWADEDSTDAWLLGQARPQGEAIPTAEKLSTIAQAVAGGGYPWTEIYQAYHRLLAYHEHTDAIDAIAPDKERMRRYETELEENREMVLESREFSGRALAGALDRLAGAVARNAERALVVFNPLAQERTDLVRAADVQLGPGDSLVDAVTGQEAPWQTMPDGTPVFVATGVPSLGYRTFAVRAGNVAKAEPAEAATTVLDSTYYRVTFDPATGAITSIQDKELHTELVDQAAPHRFNEYLYERFETRDWATPTKWYRAGSARLKASSGPVAQVMEVEAQAAGVERLRQTVVLYRALKRIDFVLDLDKSPSGRADRTPSNNPKNKESVYVALPFAVPDFTIRHELPGGVSEPVKDLFDGACTAYYAVRHFSDVSNPRFGVTVSASQSSLVEYGYPRSCPLGGPHGLSDFETKHAPILASRVYLYLMNNMFDTNIRWDQRGPVRFTYSVRSHAGDWQAGRADEFGWGVQNPLLVKEVHGAKPEGLPAGRHSFMSLDPPNVACTTVKPAEANGAGFILRFVETQGRETAATVALPFLGRISSANETSLVEEDRPEKLAVIDGAKVSFTIRPFGVKTIRVLNRPTAGVAPVAGVEARAESDLEVALRWRIDEGQTDAISHYHVYRGTKPDFKPGLLNLAQRPAGLACVDRPQLHYGGWINNRLEPATTYYYRVAAVDRWNNEGPRSPAVSVTTLKSSEKDMTPLRVECLRSVLVSPLSRFQFVNLLFRTACEPDITRYEIYRGTAPGFVADGSTLVGKVESKGVPPRSGGYGETALRYVNADYDHAMFQDDAVQPGTTYFYRVRAVDAAGQKGPFSLETSVRTMVASAAPPGAIASASSVYAPQYPPDNAIDDDPDPYAAWISASWGGGTRAEPRDTWLVVELPRKLKLKGSVYHGDERPVIPVLRNFQVQVRQGQQWTTVANVTGAAAKVVTNLWPRVVETDALRFFVAGKDLPLNDPAEGVVRVSELGVVLADGTQASLAEIK